MLQRIGRSGNLLPGLALCVGLAVLAKLASDTSFVKNQLHVSVLLLVILLGMAIRSVVTIPQSWTPGIAFCQKPVLRLAVAGLGFKLTIQELLKLGGTSLAVIACSTFFALWLGWAVARWLGIDEKLGLLLGVGGAICGASAVVAADSVVQSKKSEAVLSLGIITLLGTLGILLYPPIGHALNMSPKVFALWNGTSLHEMAQVVAAGASYGEDALKWSTVAKLARICLLAPTVLYLAWMLRHEHKEAGKAKVSPVPWFLTAFVVCAALTSTGWLSSSQTKLLQDIDLWIMAVGMAGVGLQSGFRDLKEAGLRPILTGTLQWVGLATVSYLLAIWWVGNG